MPALHLTEELATIILNASRPIAPQHRDAFLAAVTDALQSSGEIIGPGSVHRAIRTVQRAFFDPPLGDDAPDEPHPR
jgi:hypothetical protein